MFATASCNLDRDILMSTLPLFQSAEIEAIEWSFDTLYNHRNIPEWFIELLDAFGKEDRLIGHGVFFSIFSAKFTEQQQKWLTDLKSKSARFNFAHITEHFGYMTGSDFHSGAPISVPLTSTTLAIGQDRLKRVVEACEKPVGLENLALAYSLNDVQRQGGFIKQLLKPINGFLILDLHNLYCQCFNFDVEFESLLGSYDLDLVREIHISGGSWEDSDYRLTKKVRRDTHDDRVPKIVFEMLEHVIPLCPNLKFVVLEQIGQSLKTEDSRALFSSDFSHMKEILNKKNQTSNLDNQYKFIPLLTKGLTHVVEDQKLEQEQKQLSYILENAIDISNAKMQFRDSGLANSDWEVEQWSDHMLDTAIRIAQKWK